MRTRQRESERAKTEKKKNLCLFQTFYWYKTYLVMHKFISIRMILNYHVIKYVICVCVLYRECIHRQQLCGCSTIMLKNFNALCRCDCKCVCLLLLLLYAILYWMVEWQWWWWLWQSGYGTAFVPRYLLVIYVFAFLSS